MLPFKRVATKLAVGLVAVAAPFILGVGPAVASHSQIALFEDDNAVQGNPGLAFARFHDLGVTTARVYVEWSQVTRSPNSPVKPAGFDSANPDAYPPINWAHLDNVIHASLQYHIGLDFILTGGAPRWANGPNVPPQAQSSLGQHLVWQPNVAEYGNFVHAVALKYRPWVHSWEIFNEPNFGEDLAPQATNGSRIAYAPMKYRQLVSAAWSALSRTISRRDAITIGQVSARGDAGPANAAHPEGLPGNFAQTKPLIFVRALYCVDNRFKPLRGAIAAAEGCPTTAAGTRAFVRQNPGLFRASGFGIHPYAVGLPPTRDESRDPDFVPFNGIPRLESTLDRIDRAYRQPGRMSIYNNEYGYVTRPPGGRQFVSLAAAAAYINQAEYLSWHDPRIKSYMQYLLDDPRVGGPSQFFSGLNFFNGAHKPSFDSYRLPLWLPSPVTRRGRTTEVWGALRPAHFFGGRQVAYIAWRPSVRPKFAAVAAVPVRDPHGYFDVKVKFPGSGDVQVFWNEPGIGVVASRITPVTIR